jgi:hypothetical protein
LLQLRKHGGRADRSPPGRRAAPTAVQPQLTTLLCALREAPLGGRLEQAGQVGAIRVVAAIALLAGVRLAALDHRSALTVGTPHELGSPGDLLQGRNVSGLLSSKNPDLRHYQKTVKKLGLFSGDKEQWEKIYHRRGREITSRRAVRGL